MDSLTPHIVLEPRNSSEDIVDRVSRLLGPVSMTFHRAEHSPSCPIPGEGTVADFLPETDYARVSTSLINEQRDNAQRVADVSAVLL